ncbi:MAG: hypothetical protein NZ853_03675 [Leptospiraceae bacterium]|nr:hypothetical protein [Leptospiraceae bacterium]MDW7975274.1 hypothetical protein [Leptospiraceae bacterium]
MKIYYYTHRGKVRKNNEDSILIQDRLYHEVNFENLKETEINQNEILLCVADGLGGHEKGEIASFLVLDTLRKSKIKNQNDLLNSLSYSKQVLNEYAKKNPNAFGLGTVIAGIFFMSEYAIVFNVGDCRVYLYNKEKKLARISKDHSVVEELKDRGFLLEGEERYHPEKHVVTSWISGDNESKIPKVFFRSYPISFFRGGRILICSDGLWEAIPGEDMEQCFVLDNPQFVGECLIRKTFLNGAFDNISFILVENV